MDDEKRSIEKSKNGNIEAFEQLIEPYQKKVFNIALRMMGNQEDASDAAQEVFIKIYKSISGFREESSFNTWVYRIATNVCLDELRKRKRMNVVSTDSLIQLTDGEVNVQVEDKGLSPDKILEKKELIEEVKEALNHIKHEHKQVIVLRDIQGYSYKEISSIMQCSEGTVKSRINRARNAVKDILLKKRNIYRSISSK